MILVNGRIKDSKIVIAETATIGVLQFNNSNTLC